MLVREVPPCKLVKEPLDKQDVSLCWLMDMTTQSVIMDTLHAKELS